MSRLDGGVLGWVLHFAKNRTYNEIVDYLKCLKFCVLNVGNALMSSYPGDHGRDVQITSSGTSYSVSLPCEPDKFAEFISGLLGEPERIKFICKPIRYDVNRVKIISLYHLIQQRILGQNKASLILFSAELRFADGSRVKFSSIDSFDSYHEVVERRTVGIYLYWTYLVEFRGRSVPEKQMISIEIPSEIFDRGMTVTVLHTDRSWGNDLENLLRGHLKTFSRKLGIFQNFFLFNTAIVGWFMGIFVLFSGLAGFYIYNQNLSSSLKTNSAKALENLDKNQAYAWKLDFVFGKAIDGFWFMKLEIMFLAIVVLIVFSIVLGVLFARIDELVQPSSFEFTPTDEKYNKMQEKSYNSGFFAYVVAAISTVVLGVAANFVYAYIS